MIGDPAMRKELQLPKENEAKNLRFVGFPVFYLP